MSVKLKVAANTIVQLIGKGVTAGVTLLITLVIAREYGVSGFGEYIQIVSYVAIFYLVVDFGLNAVVLKKVEETDKEQYFAGLMGVRLVLSLILIFFSLAILNFLPYSQEHGIGFTPISKLGIIIMAPTILSQAIFATTNAWFQRHLRYDFSAISSSLGSILTLVLVVVLTKLHLVLFLTMISYLAGAAVMVGTALYFSGRQRFFNRYLLEKWWDLIRDAFPLGLTLVFNVITVRSVALILTLFRPVSEVGIYGLAYRFFEVPLTFPTFFMNSVYPFMLSRREEGLASLKKLTKKAVLVLLVSSTVLALLGFFLFPLITILDKGFSQSILPFRILIISLPIYFISSLGMWLLITLGRNRVLVFIYGFVMVVSVALDLFFIPRYGYLVAPIINVTGEVLVLVFIGYVSLRELRK